MNELVIKHVRLTYDEWKCIKEKEYTQARIENDDFKGYVASIFIKKVDVVQEWNICGSKVPVCDQGMRWIIILPDYMGYAVTMMLDKDNVPVVWYIDLIDKTGIDQDGIYYFDDLFLDLIVSPDGSIEEDDRDEFVSAYNRKVISKMQYDKVNTEAMKLKEQLQNHFLEFRDNCFSRMKELEQVGYSAMF